MSFDSKEELFKFLIPVFLVKQRLIKITNYQISNIDIFKYLINTKWRYSHDLTLAEIVNDIITVEISEINDFGGKYEKV